MTYKNFTVEIDKDGIAIFALNVDGETMNIWNESLIAEFPKFVDELLSNDEIKGAVITSAKDNGFLAGADLRMLESQQADTIADAFENGMTLTRILRRMETGGHSAKALSKGQAQAKPVACALEGLALGGGLELALACHYRVCSDSPKVKLGFPEVSVGLLPGAGGTQRAPRLMGLQNAAMLCTTGRPIDAKTALSQGLIDEVVPAGETLAKAKQWVLANPKYVAPWDKKGFKIPGGGGSMHPAAVQFFIAANAMAQKQTQHNYPAVRSILSCLYEGSIVPMDTALAIEVKYFVNLLSGSQSKNMIRTLFMSKQSLEKGQARPKNIDKTDIKTVGVLGAGLMGSGITHVTVKGGMDVVVLDRDMESAQKAVDYTKKIVEKRVSRGKMTKETANELVARIKPTDNYDDLKDVDLIIEAVFELPDIKADVIKKAEAVIGDDVIFASNTSTLPITGLAENSIRPEQFIGMHFFSPVEKMPLLEIIPGAKTGDKALAVAFDYNSKIKKTPIVVKDVRGFFTNRVFPAYVNEAMLMITEGIKPALIENAAINLSMPIGPLALTDETTLKLGLDIQNSTKKEMGDKYVPSGTEDFLELMVEKLGRGGRRFGAGFYDYSESGERLKLWNGMEDYYPLLAEQPSLEEVKQRLLYAQLLPTSYCYAEGVVSDPQSADIGAIFGWGFAPWTGGPMSYIDTIGVDEFVRVAENMAQKYGQRFTPPAKFKQWAEEKTKIYQAA
ncbi:MAG: 3-hydroxyacyl-CoA dehydrogenase NAD-binding domain-containing protein [bacterium]